MSELLSGLILVAVAVGGFVAAKYDENLDLACARLRMLPDKPIPPTPRSARLMVDVG